MCVRACHFVFSLSGYLYVRVCYLHFHIRIWQHFLILNLDHPYGPVVLCSLSVQLMQILDSQLCLHTNQTPAADPQQTLVKSYMAVVLLGASQAVWIHSKPRVYFWVLHVELRGKFSGQCSLFFLNVKLLTNQCFCCLHLSLYLVTHILTNEHH